MEFGCSLQMRYAQGMPQYPLYRFLYRRIIGEGTGYGLAL